MYTRSEFFKVILAALFGQKFVPYIPKPVVKFPVASAGLSHLAAVYYKRKALDRLQKVFVFRNTRKEDFIAPSSGRTVQFFRYKKDNGQS